MTGGRGKFPMEPLSDAAWKRIEREVFDQLAAEPAAPAPKPRAAPRVWLYAAALVAFVALGALAAVPIFQARTPEAGVTTSRIETAGDSVRATVGDSTVEAQARSELTATGSDERGWTVVLERGRVRFAVPKRGKRAGYRVQAGPVAIEVIGTVFTVERTGEDVQVSVSEGHVQVTHGGERRELRTGEVWRSHAPMPGPSFVPRSLPPPLPSVSTTASSLPPRPAAPPSAKTSRYDNPALLLSRPERFEAARRIEAQNPERALASYLELSRGTDGWAAQGLYAAGRLELARGRADAGRKLLSQYVARFPTGPSAGDARRLTSKTR